MSSSPASPIDDAHARELLGRERERIERSLSDSERNRDSEVSGLDQHPADDADRLQGDEVDEALDEQLREQLEAVERAERRLEEGTYGLSIESGEPIPAGRLEAIPWAERTAEEQERYEGGG
jgi:DnaK suppressor protein